MDPVDKFLAEAKEIGAWHSAPVHESVIAEAEAKLGVRFPKSYRSFLKELGALAIGDITISGILDGALSDLGGGSVVGDTLRFRSERRIPPHYIVIQPDEDAPHCIDSGQTNSQDEAPVVCYELHSHHSQVIAPSFAEWGNEFVVGKSNG